MNVRPHKRISKILEELDPGDVFFYQNRFLIKAEFDPNDDDDEMTLKALGLQNGVIEYFNRFELVELVNGEFVETTK